jgi:branched-chain amino acid transport system substrate-binding protein
LHKDDWGSDCEEVIKKQERRKKKMEKKKLIMVVSSLGLIFALFAICLLTGYKVQAQPQPKTLKIGEILPYTGPASGWSAPITRVVKLAFEKVNKAGGMKIAGETYLLDLVSTDDEASPEKARACAERLIFREKVPIILGPTTTPSTLAIMPLAEANKVILCISSTGPVKFTECMFRLSPEWATAQSMPFFTYIAKQRPTLKKWIVMSRDDEGGRTTAAGGASSALASGLQVASVELFAQGTKDFAPTITRIMALKPDGIWMEATPPEAQAFITRQAREMGFQGIIGSSTMEPSTLLKTVTNKDIEGMMTCGSAFGSELDGYKADYVAKFGEWNDLAGKMVILPNATLKALGITKSLKYEDLKYAFENVGPIPVIGGLAKWGGAVRSSLNHQALVPLGIYECKDGKLVGIDNVVPSDPPPFRTLEEMKLK